MSWQGLSLSRPLTRAVLRLGWKFPTTVQEKVIPIVLAGRDALVSAVTGSGKTGAFGIPLLERMVLRGKDTYGTTALVLSPTRELAAQTAAVLQELAYFTNFRVYLLIGGTDTAKQAAQLRTEPDIIVATPGRLIDLVRNTVNFSLDTIEVLVLDEGDKMLDIGFHDELKEICTLCPVARQTLLFSATMQKEVLSFSLLALQKPLQVQIDPPRTVAQTITQEFVMVTPALLRKCTEKFRNEDSALKASTISTIARDILLVALLRNNFSSEDSQHKIMIFCNSKREVRRVFILLDMLTKQPEDTTRSCLLNGIKPSCLHGDSSQKERATELDRFRSGDINLLVCSDVASRGLDIENVTVVIQYDFPLSLDIHIHRVGRTGRADMPGTSITFVHDNAQEQGVLKEIQDSQKERAKGQPLRQRKIDPKLIATVTHYFAHNSVPDRLKRRVDKMNLEMAVQMEEIKIKRAENIMEFKDEIFNRPKKTWFQTEAEKANLRALHARVVSGAITNKEAVRDLSKEEQKYLRKITSEAKMVKNRQENSLPPDVLASIRAKKREERNLREEGESPGEVRNRRYEEARIQRRAIRMQRKSNSKNSRDRDDQIVAPYQVKRSKKPTGFKSKKRYKRR